MIGEKRKYVRDSIEKNTHSATLYVVKKRNHNEIGAAYNIHCVWFSQYVTKIPSNWDSKQYIVLYLSINLKFN